MMMRGIKTTEGVVTVIDDDNSESIIYQNYYLPLTHVVTIVTFIDVGQLSSSLTLSCLYRLIVIIVTVMSAVDDICALCRHHVTIVNDVCSDCRRNVIAASRCQDDVSCKYCSSTKVVYMYKFNADVQQREPMCLRTLLMISRAEERYRIKCAIGTIRASIGLDNGVELRQPKHDE